MTQGRANRDKCKTSLLGSLSRLFGYGVTGLGESLYGPSVPASNVDFSSEERSLLRAAFLRIIPFSDEIAAYLYAPFAITSPERIEEAIHHLATIVDALEDPVLLNRAYRSSQNWHRNQGVSSDQLDSFGLAMVAALKSLSSTTSIGESKLWLRLWSAIRASE